MIGLDIKYIGRLLSKKHVIKIEHFQNYFNTLENKFIAEGAFNAKH